jgi:hypothetical protein
MRELPVSSQLALWWSFLWRGAVVTIGSAVLGGLLGGIFGFAVGVVGSVNGVPTASVIRISQVGGLILGAGGGLFLTYVYVRWLLSAQLGQFRLLLVRVSDDLEGGARVIK